MPLKKWGGNSRLTRKNASIVIVAANSVLMTQWK